MLHSLIRLLLFSLLLASCASDYHALAPASNPACLDSLKPKGMQTSWYRASIDVVGKHLSGLFLVKAMPDSSRRIVFTNESGVKFFDLEFSNDQSFRVAYIMPQLDRKSIIGLFQNDFELMLGVPFRSDNWQTLVGKQEYYFGIPKGEKIFYFVTDKACTAVQHLEYGSTRKRLVKIEFRGADQTNPDEVTITHHNFNMQVNLKRIAKS